MIAVQNEEYAARFLALGARPETVHVTGSLKFDRAQTDRDTPAVARLRTLAGIAHDDIVFLAGSTQEPEESLALNAFHRLSPAHPKLRLVVVPRHPERFFSVAAMLAASGVRWQRRSDLDHASPDPLRACCWSTSSVSLEHGGGRLGSASSAAVCRAAAGKT